VMPFLKVVRQLKRLGPSNGEPHDDR